MKIQRFSKVLGGSLGELSGIPWPGPHLAPVDPRENGDPYLLEMYGFLIVLQKTVTSRGLSWHAASREVP